MSELSQQAQSARLADSLPSLVAYFDLDDGPGVAAASDRSLHGFAAALVNASRLLWVESTAPLGTAVTTDEDTPIVVQLNGTSPLRSDLTWSAPLTARVTSLPARGTLYQLTSAWTRGAAIAVAGADVTGPGRRVLFVPAADDSGSPYASFSFEVHDGAQWSVNNATIRVNVRPVVDAPRLLVPAPAATRALNATIWGYALAYSVATAALQVRVTVAADSGRVLLPLRGSLASPVGGSLQFTDTAAAASAALRSIVYVRDSYFAGDDVVHITVEWDGSHPLSPPRIDKEVRYPCNLHVLIS